MRKRSTPRSTKTGQMTSRKAAARTIVPSDALGATFFAANATAKWPMNTSFPPSEQGLFQSFFGRIVAEPDSEQRAVEILAGDRLAPGLAVQHDQRAQCGKPVERDHVALFRRTQCGHDGAELDHASLQGFLLGGGRVLSDTLVERIDQLLCAQSAHQAHRDAFRTRQGQYFARARSLFREIKTRDIYLEESLGAQPGAIQDQFARVELDLLLDLDPGDFRRKRRRGEKREKQQSRAHQALS